MIDKCLSLGESVAKSFVNIFTFVYASNMEATATLWNQIKFRLL
jgi:hypothetical protein